MKTRLFLPTLLLAALTALSSPAWPLDDVGGIGERTGPIAAVPAASAQPSALDEATAVSDSSYAGDQTSRVIAVLFGVALLGLLAYWLTRRDRIYALPSETLYPGEDSVLGPPPRIDTKVIPVP